MVPPNEGEIKMVIHLTDETFENEVLKSSVPVLVDFWADWCGPCHRMAPILDELSSDIKEQGKVCKLDVDAFPQVADAYDIMSMPTILIFKKGEIIESLIGLHSKDKLKKLMLDL